MELLQAAGVIELEPPETELERIEQFLLAEPLEPFVIEMTGGKTYRIERRDQCGFNRHGSVQCWSNSNSIGSTDPATLKVGAFGNLVLVSWLEDAGKDEIYVQNIETKAVQKITSEPNRDNFRIVEVHPNADPQLLEVVISNGSEQGSVRFAF